MTFEAKSEDQITFFFLNNFSSTTVFDCQELDDKRYDLPATKRSILFVLTNSKAVYFNRHRIEQYVMCGTLQDVSASSKSGRFGGVFL